LQPVHHGLDRRRFARAVVLDRRCLRAFVKGRLRASIRKGVANRRLDEAGERFAWLQHRLQFGPKLCLDTNQGNHGASHSGNVLHMCCKWTAGMK